MRSARTISVESDIRGTPLLQPGTSEKLGKIVDVLVDPARGEVIGLFVLTVEGKERVLFKGDFSLGENLVMASEKALRDPERLDGMIEGRAYARKELIGTKVVTDEGRLLGHVSDVHLSKGWAKIVYRVLASGGPPAFIGSFQLPGEVPHSYSRSGARIIVPAGTEEKYAIWPSNVSRAAALGYRSGMAVMRDFLGRHAIPILVALTLGFLGIMLWY